MSNHSGHLYVIATPIGNLEDLGQRAANVLADVDFILAEDTRHSGKLLKRTGISSHIIAYHEHNESEVLPEIIKRLKAGEKAGLITDAGTPLISDPGYSLVVAAHENGISVIPIPGPSAVISALSVAGLATDKFIFEGYLPARKIARQKYLQTMTNETRTIVFFEVPHRIMQSLDDLIVCFGKHRKAALAKELTKVHEMVYRNTLSTIRDWLMADKSRQKGEFVVLVAGAEKDSFDLSEATRTLKILLESLPVREAVPVAAKLLRGRKNDLYKLALKLRDET